jgi:plasmid stabilization system protein ParE
LSLPLWLHPLAADDLVAAWSWYEEQVPGLGDRFLEAARATIDRVAEWPGSGAPILHDDEGAVVERRAPTPGFPYAVRYRVIDDVVVVMAVHDQRRHPDAAADREP